MSEICLTINTRPMLVVSAQQQYSRCELPFEGCHNDRLSVLKSQTAISRSLKDVHFLSEDDYLHAKVPLISSFPYSWN